MSERATLADVKRCLKAHNRRADKARAEQEAAERKLPKPQCEAQVLRPLRCSPADGIYWVPCHCKRKGTKKRFGGWYCWQHAKKARKPVVYGRGK
jgi:hypothetical protein